MSEAFEFTKENRQTFERILARYPVKRAALLPALHLVQEQHGFVPPEAERYVSDLLEVPLIDVREVLTFYSLYFREKKGRHHIRLCMSIACWIRGCDGIRDRLQAKLGVEEGGTTSDGRISWEAVPDCLGACEMAPMLQLDGYFHADLTPERVDELLGRLASQSTE